MGDATRVTAQFNPRCILIQCDAAAVNVRVLSITSVAEWLNPLNALESITLRSFLKN